MTDRLRYLALRAFFGLLDWGGRRLTPAGRLAAAALVTAAARGLDTNQSMAFQGFTLLAALLGAAALAGAASRPRLRARRALPRFGTAEQPLPYKIVIENPGNRPLRDVALEEELGRAYPTFAELRADADPSGSELHWVDRATGFSRWRRAARRRRSADAPPTASPEVPAGGRIELDASLLPLRRGRLDLAGLTASRPDPLGLVRATARASEAASVLILPKRYPVPRLELPGTRRYQQGGVALAASIGDSQEFVGLREYRPGDPLRRIHWKSWAKTGSPVVREHQDEYFVRHGLALDTFGAPGPAFEEAVSVAASFACSVLTQESLLDLLFVGTDAFCVTAGRGLGGADRLLEVLACVEPCRGRPFRELADGVARRHDRLSGCICLLLAWDEERRAFLRSLRSLGIPSLALLVAAPGAPRPEPADGVRVLEPGRVGEGLALLDAAPRAEGTA